MKFKYITVLLITFLLSGLTSAGAVELGEINIHGFISQGYLKTSDNNYLAQTEDGTFEFNEFGINFGKKLTDKLHVGIQLMSKDLGVNYNNEIVIDWAYGDYRWKDWLGIRVGKLKAPHGLYNETRDVDALRNSIFMPQSVYPDIERDAALNLIGAGIYGNINMNMFGGLQYQLMAGTQNISVTQDLALSLKGVTWGGTEVIVEDSIEVDKKYVMGLIWDTPLNGLRIGSTYQQIAMNMVSNYDFTQSPIPFYGAGTFYDDLKSDAYVVSVEYTWNDLLVAAEYMWAKRDLKYETGAGLIHDVFKPDGWYFQAAYRFNDWFELGAYYSEYYANKHMRDGEGINPDTGLPWFMPSDRAYLKDICLTARFDINEYWVMKLEGHKMDGTSQLNGFDNPLPSDYTIDDFYTQFDDDWWMFAAKFTFNF